MCGIAGIWYRNKNGNGKKTIKKMTDIIAHRGPDGEGHALLNDGHLFIGHRRLSIIDLSNAGKQPMSYHERYTITFNGEIYNYIEIRNVLRAKGYRFRTNTDTEVVMAAYDFWGIYCLQQFDGMFAFALYDNANQELFCARDRFGEKPFHYYDEEDFFAFGSEMKSLWMAGANRTFDEYSIYLFINMGLHEDPEDKTRTFYRHIKRLKPAHYFKIKRGERINQKSYWQLNVKSNLTDLTFNEASVKFRDLFETSVARRLRSDVSVGTSLSGGIDSASVTLIMERLLNANVTQKCFSARFDDPILDEGYFMKKVVEGTKIEHIETWPDVNDLVTNFEKIMFHQEEPFGSASIYAQWEVFRLAKENNVTVLLDGQGADEVLGGYTHFFLPFFRETYRIHGNKALQNEYNAYLKNNVVKNPVNINQHFKLETVFPAFFETMRGLKRSFKGVNACPEIHPKLYEAYKNQRAPFTVFNELNSSLNHYTIVSGLDKLLRFADRNSMAHSREVRLPFLNHELVEFVFSAPSNYKIHNGWTKALLRYGLTDILPQEVAWRKNKLGFQPPQKKWELNKTFKEYTLNMQSTAIANGYINKNAPFCWKGVVIGLFLNQTPQQ